MKTVTVNNHDSGTEIFARRESAVRSYSRSFPALFAKAKGARLFDANGKPYLDFLAGAGSLNYGHNHPVLRDALIRYLQSDGIVHGLDLHTEAKSKFLESFQRHILEPRGMDYVVQFTGPTGTNAVEAALKLARRVTGRTTVVSFTNGFHGVTSGSLAATGNSRHRSAAGLPLLGAVAMPYDGYFGPEVDTAQYLEKMITDRSSGLDHPAALIVETVQGEGGLNTASLDWLRSLRRLCDQHGIVMIVDDIQAGCGRTGNFFSFEEAGIQPDIVTLSKSLSGYGLPFAVVLIKRHLDVWEAGEHNGTFRGNNPAFVTAAASLDHFWADQGLSEAVRRKSGLLADRLAEIAGTRGDVTVRGRGMMQGLVFPSGDQASAVSRAAFRRGLIIETSGPNDEVVKCLCPLTITEAELREGLDILRAAVVAAGARATGLQRRAG